MKTTLLLAAALSLGSLSAFASTASTQYPTSFQQAQRMQQPTAQNSQYESSGNLNSASNTSFDETGRNTGWIGSSGNG
jgi:hypothetical protein